MSLRFGPWEPEQRAWELLQSETGPSTSPWECSFPQPSVLLILDFLCSSVLFACVWQYLLSSCAPRLVARLLKKSNPCSLTVGLTHDTLSRAIVDLTRRSKLPSKRSREQLKYLNISRISEISAGHGRSLAGVLVFWRRCDWQEQQQHQTHILDLCQNIAIAKS